MIHMHACIKRHREGKGEGQREREMWGGRERERERKRHLYTTKCGSKTSVDRGDAHLSLSLSSAGLSRSLSLPVQGREGAYNEEGARRTQ
jgi:hypothetical protein